MSREELLRAFRSGEISAADALCRIKALDPPPAYPLGEGQRGLWALEKAGLADGAYNVPLCLRFRAGLAEDLFKSACEFVWAQHATLRTVFEETDGAPKQRIAPLSRVPFVREDAAEWTEDETREYLRRAANAPFALAREPLLRVYLLSRPAGEYVALLVVHHIVFDGTSAALLLQTLTEAYARLARGERLIPAVLPASYQEFVEWEREAIAGPAGQQHRSYWVEQLAGELPVIELPTDRPRSARTKSVGDTCESTVSAAMARRLVALSVGSNVSLSVLFLAVYKLLLHSYTGETDLIVGMPASVRPQSRFDPLVGYFLNMIPIRCRIDAGLEFATWVQTVQDAVVEGLDHAAYPFARLVRDLKVPRQAARPPVFQVAYEYQNASMLMPRALRQRRKDALQAEFVDGIHQDGEYELVLEVIEQEAGFVVRLKYDSSLFEKQTAARMLEHYFQLLTQVIEQPRTTLSSCSPMTPEQLHETLVAWNATDETYPADSTVHELFAAQAMRTPESCAVAWDGGSLSYRELDERSDRLAAHLRARGVQPGERVGICVGRSVHLPIGLLAILKAGAAYVPFDPAYPRERLRFMVEDSGARYVATESSVASSLPALLGETVQPILLDREPEPVPDAVPQAPQLAASLAYVMYTSGSTGRPKGVMVSHRSLVNFLYSMRRAPGMSAGERLMAVTTYSFDIAGLELYLPLLFGAECYLVAGTVARDAELLKREISRVRPHAMQATPTMWSMLLEAGWRNEQRVRVLCGGEPLPPALRRHFVRSGWEAWNLYGPTETTVWSTVERIERPDGNGIGKPIANTQIYLFDAHDRPAPPLALGELCIGGDGLATGYLNRPGLTAEKFVANPFKSGARLYRTGDLAYWRGDGTIEYVGRADAQVKIRGFRVELGEIESRLAAHPRIAACAVIATEHEGHKRMTACCVLRRDGGLDDFDVASPGAAQALREHLRAALPEYMVPARFIAVEAIPLTPSGKVDRRKLADIAAARRDESTAPDAGTAPDPGAPERTDRRHDVERRLRLIWQSALASSDFGPDDGFFDIGGDSVLAVTVAARIETEFGAPFAVTDMFRLATIRAAARHLEQLAGARKESPVPAEPRQPQQEPRQAPEHAQVASSDVRDSVAIIGLSCRFPGANDHREFWNALIDAREGIERLSEQALREAGVPASASDDPAYVPVRASVPGKDLFDADFFKISPRDAQLMDPQLRLLLQHAWSAVEDAGYIGRDIPSTGVFIASSHSDYAARLAAAPSASAGTASGGERYVAWLFSQPGTIPTTISHRLGFRGPSLAVHSNCSSSLVALHAAFKSLREGEVRQALVGAATVFAADSAGYLHASGLNFSSDGRVKTFDAAADGMIGGEGVAVVLLKRAAEAIADGDHIYALIRGVAVNNDGAEKVGFYAPSVEGQADVIRKALRGARVDARSITYVEAHGTGTELGDPIELAAISDAYREHTAERQFCGIGSVKSNIGHADTAAGLAGLIKVALSLEHEELPPTLHYRAPNPKLEIEQSPFYVVAQRTPWQRSAMPRRAALSSFGIGGTNAHAILEEAPATPTVTEAPTGDRGTCLIPLSARTAERLRANVSLLRDEIAARGLTDEDLPSIAYTLQTGREPMQARVAFAVETIDELQEKLTAYLV
jgi:amino acid adenylation domain-containing protein